MEPLKPEAKRQLLLNNPLASSEDVEEYERLLSERFTVDPSLPTVRTAANSNGMAAPSGQTEEVREARLKVLYQRLYPSKQPMSSTRKAHG